jgi:hypothetical protein
MHASLHDDVSQLLEADGLLVEFHATGGFQDCVESYDTNIMGRFNCSYAACPVQKWSSKMIAITIRLYRNESHIVSKDGLEYRSRSHTTPAKVRARIRGTCAKVAITDIVGRFFDLRSRYYAPTRRASTYVAYVFRRTSNAW